MENQTPAERYLTHGRELFSTQRFEEALGELRHALNVDPNLIDAYVLIADIYWILGAKETAIDWLSKAYEQSPSDFHTRKRIALFWFAHGATENDFRTAFDWFYKALQIEPNNPDTLFSAGFCLSLVGEKSSAEQYFKRVRAIAPNHEEMSRWDRGEYENLED
jgi:tetratricopeptide (TPR) repeat protein